MAHTFHGGEGVDRALLISHHKEESVEFVELPQPPRRKLMRDVWMGAMSQIMTATITEHADTAPSLRPWVCVYDENHRSEYTPLLTHADVDNGTVKYYRLGVPGGTDIRPAHSVLSAIRAQLVIGDASGDFEVRSVNGYVFARYVGTTEDKE